LTIWSPDTCDCIIEYNKRGNWIKSHQNCRLHDNLRGQNHKDTVVAQNQRFNMAFPEPLTDNQREITFISKSVNRYRIQAEPTRNNPNFDEHLPFEQALTWFQNLRRVLRI